MPKKMMRRRVTGPLSPDLAARMRQARKDVEAHKEDLIARGKAFLLGQQVATLLKGVRQERGLTASDVAARMGIDAGNFSRLESGQSNPTLDTVARYAEALGVELAVVVKSN